MQTSSHPPHHASPLPSKENVWEVLTSETVSPQSYELLESPNPNSSVSKTYLDCYQPPLFPEPNPAHISNRCSRNFGRVGTMHNGLLSERNNLEVFGQVKGSCLLPRPGALSWSGKGRPPGTTKSEAKAKKLGILQKKEVFNPEWLEVQFGLPIGWTDPQEYRAATELLERVEQPSEISSTPELQRYPFQGSAKPSQSNGYSTSTPSASVKEQSGKYSTSKPTTLKAISLWQPWASLISLGLKHYETRSWKTKYRGKLLICSTLNNPKHRREYLKIKDDLQLPSWNEENFPHGQAIAICDLVDCIEMTPDSIAEQSRTEILCGDWQVGRYAWKLENIQPITEPFAVKGKQGLFNVSSTNLERYLKKSTSTPSSKKSKFKSSDCWYTPPHIIELVIKVLGQIDLDPCADDGKHIPAQNHYTLTDDGLGREWKGRVFMNPPYSCPGLWMSKLRAEVEARRVSEAIRPSGVSEAIALVSAATDTKWLSPVLEAQPVCFWKGRIKFLDTDYQPKSSARQSHVLVYWGENWERFKEVFSEYGFVSIPSQFLEDKFSQRISSRKMKGDDKFLEDKPNNKISSRKNGDDAEFLEDKLDDDISSRKMKDGNKFLEDKPNNKISSRKTRRTKGDGSGCIYYRTVTKKGKEYREAYYQYEFWKEGDTPRRGRRSHRLAKSSRYVPKRLVAQVQQLEAEKAPVREILQVLGVIV